VLSGKAPTLTPGNATLSASLGSTPAAGDRLFVAVITTPAVAVSGTFNGVPPDGTTASVAHHFVSRCD
jgi:hypothetical protein